MTTIAYHHASKKIAIDSRVSSGGIIDTDAYNKTISNGSGIWFLAGALSDCKEFSELEHGATSSRTLSCSALLIRDGCVYEVTTNDNKCCTMLEITFNATLGSGRNFALAAMDYGASAADAVKYAATRDMYSGGKVRVFNVK